MDTQATEIEDEKLQKEEIAVLNQEIDNLR
jgi:hypothetical protein